MPFTIRYIGGPAEGVRYTNRLEDYGLSWPLPDELEFPVDQEWEGKTWKGKYVKISESELPVEAAQHPNIGLGAQFQWEDTPDG